MYSSFCMVVHLHGCLLASLLPTLCRLLMLVGCYHYTRESVVVVDQATIF